MLLEGEISLYISIRDIIMGESMNGEKEVIAQAQEILEIQQKANEIRQKLLALRVELADIYSEIEKLEKQYERYFHVRHTEKEWKELKEQILETWYQAYKRLVVLHDLIFDAFF